MSVKTELVIEHLVDRVLGEVLARMPGEPPPEIEFVLDDAPEAITGTPPAGQPESSAAIRLARAGYLERVVECELFEPARAPTPDLAGRLEDWTARKASRIEAIKTLSRELALAEPDAKPDPGEGSWIVPGPGGHVRHFLADGTREELASGRFGEGDAKRLFLYGFYVRCCEEARETPSAPTS